MEHPNFIGCITFVFNSKKCVPKNCDYFLLNWIRKKTLWCNRRYLLVLIWHFLNRTKIKDYHYIIFVFALASALMAYIPIIANRLKISYTVPLVVLGMLFFYYEVPVDWPKPIWEHKSVKIVTEIIVIISLMGAGLRIGMRYGLHHWKNPMRLIHTAMPLYMLGIYFLARYGLQFDNPSSVLLAAVCAPTDPVLASDLQLQEDELGTEKNTGMRYLLTAEAGINDGVAFPFVFLAILWSKAGSFEAMDFSTWISYYLIYKIIAGVLVGAFLGFLYSLSLKRINSNHERKVLSGFVGIALAFLSFSLTELLNGYGFLAAFFTGMMAQYHNHRSRHDSKKSEILMFNAESEKFLIVLWTLLFGGFIASGILSFINFKGVVVAITLIVVLRPMTSRLALLGTAFTIRKKWAVAFFGIKGVGSFFYLAFALNEGNFSNKNELYAIVSLLVLLSIIVHGLTGPRVVDYFKRNNPG